jgi:hypothetical protein
MAFLRLLRLATAYCYLFADRATHQSYCEQEPMSAAERQFDVIVLEAELPCAARKIDLSQFGHNFRGAK